MLTLGLITARKQPKFEWMLDSLALNGIDPVGQIILVDYFAQPCDGWSSSDVSSRAEEISKLSERIKVEIQWVSPKPNIWGGPHRLPKESWWHASASRNTVICLATGTFVALLDDRCVLLPGYLQSIREAMVGNYAVFGSYQKRTGMKVENGVITHGGIITGEDHREDYVKQWWASVTPAKCPGEWAFGCSLALPLEWALQVNGYDETCDGLSMEDVIFGLHLQNNGFDLRYDYRSKMIEDRTPSELGKAMRREDKGVSPNDKSHALLALLRDRKTANNPFDIRQLRESVLAGNPWPIPTEPTHDWYDNQPISEFK